VNSTWSRVARLLAMVGVAFWARQAKANCEYVPDGTSPYLDCYSPWGSDVAVSAEIGSDPNGYSQWIRWTNLEENGCWWDYLCWDPSINDWCSSDPGQLIQNVVVEGPSYAYDYLETRGSGNVFGCSFDLTAPVCNGHTIDMLGGGDDPAHRGSLIAQSSACRGKMFGSWEGDGIYSDRPDAYAFGDNGDDSITLYNQGFYAWVDASFGNDIVWLWGSTAPNMGTQNYPTCGDGDYDQWAGPGTRPLDCEYDYPIW
jgi:hypothetical protein